MDRSEGEKLKLVIATMMSFWQEKFGLKEWVFAEKFYWEGIPDRDGLAPGWKRLMRVVPDWRYERSDIDFNLLALSDYNNQAIELFLIHELLHLVVAEMCPSENNAEASHLADHEERVVTRLARAIQGMCRETRPWLDLERFDA